MFQHFLIGIHQCQGAQQTTAIHIVWPFASDGLVAFDGVVVLVAPQGTLAPTNAIDDPLDSDQYFLGGLGLAHLDLFFFFLGLVCF